MSQMPQAGMLPALNSCELLHNPKQSVTIDTLPITLPITPPETPTKESTEIFCPENVTPQPVSQFKISTDTEPLVAVIGVGYVGTHLVSNFSRHWNVLGFDLSQDRVQALRADSNFTQNTRVKFTTSRADLADATHYLISVPTLLLPDKTVDVSYLESALEATFQYARPGATVVIESSVAVGMTRKLLGPLAKTRRCFAGMSPEVSPTTFKVRAVELIFSS